MSVDMNQTLADASLDRMHDIIVPDAVGFFPPAPGWYILLLLSLALLFHVTLQAYRRYRADAYRREALQEISTYSEPNRENVLALLSLAKRVGISAYGREKIASLSDDAWWDFMETHSDTVVDQILRAETRSLLYDVHVPLSDAQFDRLLGTVDVWIKSHREIQNV